MENTNQSVSETEFAHFYIAREDGDFGYLLTLTSEHRFLQSNITRVLEAGGEEVLIIESDSDQHVDVLVHDAEIAERITA
jgi:hypothetical protein